MSAIAFGPFTSESKALEFTRAKMKESTQMTGYSLYPVYSPDQEVKV